MGGDNYLPVHQVKSCHQQERWILHSVNNKPPDITVPKDQPLFHVFEVETIVFRSPKAAT